MVWKTTHNLTEDKLKKGNWVQYDNESPKRSIDYIRIDCCQYEYDASYSLTMLVRYSASIATNDPLLIRWFKIRGFTETQSNVENSLLFTSPQLYGAAKSRDDNKVTNDFANLLLELETHDASIHEVITNFYAVYSYEKPYSININEFYYSLENDYPEKAIAAALEHQTKSNFPLLNLGKILEEKLPADHVIQFYQSIQPTCPAYKECNQQLIRFLSNIDTSKLTAKKRLNYLEHRFKAALFTCDKSGDSLFWQLGGIQSGPHLAICTQGSVEETASTLINIANEMRKLNDGLKSRSYNIAKVTEALEAKQIIDTETPKQWISAHSAEYSSYVNLSPGKIHKIKIATQSYSNSDKYTCKVDIETDDPDLIRFFSLRCYLQNTVPNDESRIIFTTHILDATASRGSKTSSNEFANFLLDLFHMDETISDVIFDFYSYHSNIKTFSIDLHFFHRLLVVGDINAALDYAHALRIYEHVPYLQFGRLLEEAYQQNADILLSHMVKFYNAIAPNHKQYINVHNALLKFLLSLDPDDLNENEKIYVLEQKFRSALIIKDKVAPYFYRELCGDNMNDPLIDIKHEPDALAQMYIELARRMHDLTNKKDISLTNVRPAPVGELGFFKNESGTDTPANNLRHQH